jgi:hypothetical protein
VTGTPLHNELSRLLALAGWTYRPGTRDWHRSGGWTLRPLSASSLRLGRDGWRGIAVLKSLKKDPAKIAADLAAQAAEQTAARNVMDMC